MKKIYKNLIQCIKDRDYESVAWILNYTDPKALYDLIFKMVFLTTGEIDKDYITIAEGERQIATLSYSIENDYVTVSVKFPKNEETDCIKMIKSFYPKYQFITLSLLYKNGENAFSLDRCCHLEDCIYTKFEREMISGALDSKPVKRRRFKSIKTFNKYISRIIKSLYPSIYIIDDN